MLLFFTALSSVFAFGKKEKSTLSQPASESTAGSFDSAVLANPEAGDVIKITGMIQIYGNEPFTFTGIVAEDGTEYAVYPSSIGKELEKLQGHLIEFSAILLDKTQGYDAFFLKGGTVTPLEWKIVNVPGAP